MSEPRASTARAGVGTDRTGWNATPGEHPAVRIDDLVAVFSAGSAGERAADRIARQRPASPIEALDLLVEGGIAGIPGFFVGTLADGVVSGFVRGEFAIRVEDDRWNHETADAGTARTWREVAFEGVARAWVGATAERARSADPRAVVPFERPMTTGTAAVDTLVWRSASGTTSRSSATTLPLPDAFPDGLFAPASLTEPAEPAMTFGWPLRHEHDGATMPTTRLDDDVSGTTSGTGVATPRTASPAPGAAEGRAADSAGGFEHASWVSAVICANGHANPPERLLCRVCGDELTGGRITRVTRPSLGGIRFPDGMVIPITGTIVLGRAPRAERTDDAHLPTLVTVPTDSTDVSRNHVRVALEGWTVLVEDLASTNGTTIASTDGYERPLRPGETTIVVDGDVIDLGGAVRLVFVGVP